MKQCFCNQRSPFPQDILTAVEHFIPRLTAKKLTSGSKLAAHSTRHYQNKQKRTTQKSCKSTPCLKHIVLTNSCKGGKVKTFPFSALTLLVGRQNGLRPVKKLGVGLLVVMI